MDMSLLPPCPVQVEQFQCVVPHTKLLLQLASVLSDHMSKEPNYKVRGCRLQVVYGRWYGRGVCRARSLWP